VTPAPSKALITGAEGQLGLELQATAPAGWAVQACGSADLDVTNSAAVRGVLASARPEVVIHAAAYTAVDTAEIDAVRAEAVNAGGTVHVAEAAREVGARLLHVSTDFVFDGAQGQPYRPEDPPNPLGVYGRTKLQAERAVARVAGDRGLTIRTAWLYSRHGGNFVRTMLRLMKERDELGVVCDQVGTPTWSRSLAEALWAAVLRPDLHGLLHWTDAGVASWYDFAVAIQEEGFALGLLTRQVPVRPLNSREYPTRARRPSYSVLDARGSWDALDLHPPHWRVNLRRMLEGLARG
jgi:dTDP-4-dehydrorhamnose reductase